MYKLIYKPLIFNINECKSGFKRTLYHLAKLIYELGDCGFESRCCHTTSKDALGTREAVMILQVNCCCSQKLQFMSCILPLLLNSKEYY